MWRWFVEFNLFELKFARDETWLLGPHVFPVELLSPQLLLRIKCFHFDSFIWTKKIDFKSQLFILFVQVLKGFPITIQNISF